MKLKFFIYIIFLPLMFGCAKQKKTNSKLVINYLKEAAVEAESGNFAKAYNLAEQAYKMDPTPQNAALKATLLYQLKKFDESAALFKKIIDDPKTSNYVRSDVKNNYACNLLCLNRKEEAKQIWHDLAMDKNYLSPEVAWFNLGLMEFSEGITEKRDPAESKQIHANIKFTNSANLFAKAVDIASNYIDAYFYLALCQAHLKQFEHAKDNLLLIISKIPEHTPAKQLLAKIDEEITKNRQESSTQTFTR